METFETKDHPRVDELLQLPHTGVANTIDLGDVRDIHPKDKEPIGRRLAQLAVRDVNNQNVIAGGPQYKAVEISGSVVTIPFDDAGGLTTTDGKPPAQFWLTDKNRNWQRAAATIKGKTIELQADGLTEPVAVRYAFAGFPKVNLVNETGLPAYPFRTDTWKTR